MSEELNFTAEEFADYWDSLENHRQLGEDFMAQQLQSEEGKALLAATATNLARRHGVSSKKIMTFRTSMRAACKKMGIDILTPKKVKGTGTDEVLAEMVLHKSTAQDKPKVADGATLAYNRMKRWVDKGEVDLNDLNEAITKFYV